jgi:hypothetical protein
MLLAASAELSKDPIFHLFTKTIHMRRSFLFVLLFALFSCGSADTAKEAPGKDTTASQKTEAFTTLPKVEATAFNASLDSLSIEAKEAKLKEAGVASTADVDAYCPVCNRRCCSPCFAGATRQCAYLKFENCSVCNHSSNGHYAVAHQ